MVAMAYLILRWLPWIFQRCGGRFEIYKKSLKIPKGGNQNLYLEEQTTHWPKEKVQKDKQRSTKHTYKTKDRVIRTKIKTGSERRCSGRISSSCSTSGTRRINLVTILVLVALGYPTRCWTLWCIEHCVLMWRYNKITDVISPNPRKNILCVLLEMDLSSHLEYKIPPSIW